MQADESKTEAGAEDLFARVLAGVDASPESLEAARQAAVLTDPDGTLTVLAAWLVPASTLGVVTPALAYELDEDAYREQAESALDAAKAALAPLASPATKIVRGAAWEALIDEAEQGDVTLIVVGSHGQGRMRGILVGSTATEVIHKATCSVLVAREAGDDFPRRVVVGVDGSPQSAAAYAAARQVADRFGSELWPVVAHGGKGVDKAAVATVVDYRHEDLPDEPVPALVAASADADLVVVGSRGLHGLKALGSVSERVAHEAHCSTLIVHGAAGS